MIVIKATRHAEPSSIDLKLHPRNMTHVRWLYRQFRTDGMTPADARMNLVFAISAGQRDMRTKIEQVLR